MAKRRGSVRGKSSKRNFLNPWWSVAALGLALAGGALTLWSYVGSGADTGVPSTAGNLFQDLPPQFLNNAQGMLSANITQCALGQATNAMGAIGTAESSPGVNGWGGALSTAGLSLGGSSMTASCPAVADLPQNPSCSEVQDGNRFSPARLDALRTRVEQSRAALACQNARLQALQAQVTCLQRQAQALTQQLAGLQQAYAQNIANMQTYIGRLKDMQAGREAQRQEVQKFLHGDQASGREGLLDLEQRTEALLNGLPAQIQDKEEKFRALSEQEQTLEETVETETAALAQQCFTTRVQPNYTCNRAARDAQGHVQGVQATNAKDYLLCRFEQESHRDSTGHITRNNTAVDQASANQRSQLEALMNQIFGDTPNNPNLPGGANPQQFADQAEQFSNQPINVLSVADVESRYGDTLRSFSRNGVDVHGFVISALSGCFHRAEQQVQRERRREGTRIGRLQSALTRQRRAVNTEVSSMMNDLAQQYGHMVRALTGNNFQPNVVACRNQRPEVQVGCLRNLETNFQGLLNGSTENSNVVLNFRGNQGTPSLPSMQCAGIKGCVSLLQRVDTNLGTEITAIQQKRQQDAREFNISVDRFTQQMAGGLSGFSNMLDQQLQQMNAAMASLGVTPGVTINRVTPCNLEHNSDLEGLYNPPTDMVCLVGGHMSPPMLNFAQDNFANGLQGVARKQQEVTRQMTQAGTALAAINGLANRCGSEELQREDQAFRQLMSQWNTSNCNYAREFCGPDANAPISNLADSMRSISSDGSGGGLGGSSYSSSSSDPLGSLASGVGGLCTGGSFSSDGQGDRGPAGAGDVDSLQTLSADLDSALTRYDMGVVGSGGNPTDGSVSCPSSAGSASATVTATSTSTDIENTCVSGAGTRPPDTCPASVRAWLTSVRGCLTSAKSRVTTMVTRTERLTGEHRVNAGTCAGLYHDMEGRAQRIADIQHRIGDSNAGGAQ